MAIDTQPVLAECFAGGSNGGTIPAAVSPGYQSLGTADGCLFDTVSIGSGQAMTYSNTVVSGLQMCWIVTTGTTPCYGMWTASGLLTNAAAQQWYRVFLYWPSNPTSAEQVFSMLVSGTRAADVVINTNGTISVRNTSGTVIVTTTNTIPLNQLFRIEGYITSNASTGQVELKLYSSPWSATRDGDANISGEPEHPRRGTESSPVRCGDGRSFRPDLGPVGLRGVRHRVHRPRRGR